MENNIIWNPLLGVNEELPIIDKADGIYIYDTNGKKYLDANSGLWNLSFGYSDADIQAAIIEQVKKVPYINCCEFNNESAVQLAKMLKDILHDNIEKIFFTCTGSESNELAIKLARKYQNLKLHTSRKGIGIFANSYHGSYYGSMSSSNYGNEFKSGYGPMLEEFYLLSLPFCRCCHNGEISESCVEDMVSRMLDELEKIKNSIGAIIMELVLGSAGVIQFPKKVVQVLSEYCKENDILLIVDEVATGFGRTGKYFCYEHYGIQPDIVTMSKGINGGYLPLGAVAVSDKICQVFGESKEILFHLSTQNSNPICCAAGVAVMDKLKKNSVEIFGSIIQKGDYFRQKLYEKLDMYPETHDIRGIGLMTGVDLIDKNIHEPISYNNLMYLVKRLKKKGILVEWNCDEKLTSCLTIFLPFIISYDEIDYLTEKIAQGIGELHLHY
jgi:adenosylmethionine-8-amino-7-oxononanoate aminotransferase